MTLPDRGKLAKISEWIDASNRDRMSGMTREQLEEECLRWGRLAKISEENGEVIEAYIGVTAQNPRKGETHTMGDVGKELLDTAVTALAAYESQTGNRGRWVEALFNHIDALTERAGLV